MRAVTMSWGVVVTLLLVACAPAATQTAVVEEPASFSSEQVQQAVKLEQMRGHLASALANAQAGRMDLAKVHTMHPLGEDFPAIEAAIKGKNSALATKASQALLANVQLMDGQADAQRLEAAVADTNKVLDEVAQSLLPETTSGNLAFRAQVMAELVERSVDEYTESVVNGAVREVEEYQDAYGFFQRARAVWRGFEDQVKAKAPLEYEEIQEQLDHMKTAFVSVSAPERPIAPTDVEGWAKKLTSELAEATGFEEGAQAPAGGTPAADLQGISKYLAEAIEALEKGDVAKAKHEYAEFDEGWERVEDGIRAKSRDTYRTIEMAMGEVSVTLAKPERPDAAKALAALRALAKTADASIPTLR